MEVRVTFEQPARSERPPRKLEHFERILMRSAAGAQLLAVIHAHAAEVFRLITRQRRVAATWQRNEGPAFVHAIVESGLVEGATIPKNVAGVTLELLLLRLADALQRYGSPELRRTIADHAPTVLRWSRECESLAQLLRVLEQVPAEVAE